MPLSPCGGHSLIWQKPSWLPDDRQALELFTTTPQEWGLFHSPTPPPASKEAGGVDFSQRCRVTVRGGKARTPPGVGVIGGCEPPGVDTRNLWSYASNFTLPKLDTEHQVFSLHIFSVLATQQHPEVSCPRLSPQSPSLSPPTYVYGYRILTSVHWPPLPSFLSSSIPPELHPWYNIVIQLSSHCHHVPQKTVLRVPWVCTGFGLFSFRLQAQLREWQPNSVLTFPGQM